MELFKDHIEYTGPIFDRIQKPSANSTTLKQLEYYSSTVKINSPKIRKELEKYNIIPRKTFTYKFPEQLKDHPDARHFIRGCIDGDGTAGVGTNSVSIGFCGNQIFVREVFDFIKEKCNLDKDTGTYCEYPTYAVFSFHKYNDILKIKDYLYKDATVYLKRKYDRIIQIDNVEYYFNHFKHNENIFSREFECEKQFYLAGYIFSKSCIRNLEHPYIRVSNSNLNEINFVKDLFGTNAEISDTIENNRLRYRLFIFSKQIIEDFTNNFNFKYIKHHKYSNHFVRGCLDAKSTIFKDQKLDIFMIPGDKEYLNNMSNIIQQYCKLEKPNINKKSKNSYTIKYAGIKIKTILKFLYKNAMVYLPERYEKIKHLLG